MRVGSAWSSLTSALPGIGSDKVRYTALPTATSSSSPSGRSSPQRRRKHGDRIHNREVMLRRYSAPRTKSFKMFLVASVGIMIFFTIASYGRTVHGSRCELTGNCTGISPHTWGQYSPYFSAPSEIDLSTPEGCELTMGVVLARHGSRDPTARKSELYRDLVSRLQRDVIEYAPGFEFVKSYEYKLGADQLTAFGEDEMYHSGVSFHDRYSRLIQDNEVFVRASDSGRVVASAKKFIEGMYETKGPKEDWKDKENFIIIPEEETFNNTLDSSSCPAFKEGPASQVAHKKQLEWMNVWVPGIQKRLNARMPGANLTLDETIYMMDLCPFNTVASIDATQSGFCRLFSTEEWYNYDYFESLDKWYGHGPGNPLGPTQGVGYVNELIARLTGENVTDSTTTNSTLDSSPETFPLDRKLYADFSHDNTMASIYGALGLYRQTSNLPTGHKVPPARAHGYSAAWTVPFAGRMYVEKMECSPPRGDAKSSGATRKKHKHPRPGEEDIDDPYDEQWVRILVNDRVVPLQNCGADRLGRCKLSKFVESLSFAREGGHWDKCYS